MTQGSRSSQSQTSFDFNSQAGVAQVLLSVRKSEMPLESKNELRDLVFLYANSGGDSAIRNTLEKQLLAHNLHPVSSVKASHNTDNDYDQVSRTPQRPTVHYGFSGARPAPQSFVTAPQPAVSNTPVTPTATQSVADTKSSSPRKVSPTIRSSVRDAKSKVLPQTSDSVVTKTSQDVDSAVPVPAKVLVRNTSPAASPTTSPATVAASDAVGSEYIQRIKDIKGDVNKTFGNPVNLVDINNEVGREYMSALLAAMKIISSGSPVAIKDAMERLEVVYKEIKRIDTSDSPSLTGSHPTVPSQKPAPVSTDKTSPAVSVPASSQSSDPAVASVKPAPAQSVASQSASISSSDKSPTSHATAMAASPHSPQPSPAVAVTDESVNANSYSDSQLKPVAARQPQSPAKNPSSTTPEPAVSAESVNTPRYMPVADAPSLHTPNDLPDPKEVANASVNGDPLYTPQIDAGLEQLLQEWPLFNKSGLFGTGPKGREHPLFIKLADLQIPLILAGRFEGANPAIKQSVTDYMNGWRYEQGILYNKGETFEQYLRRVIKHIIDLQEAKSAS